MRDTSGPQMVSVLKQPPKWESRLILPTTSFPNRGKEYTVSEIVFSCGRIYIVASKMTSLTTWIWRTVCMLRGSDVRLFR